MKTPTLRKKIRAIYSHLLNTKEKTNTTDDEKALFVLKQQQTLLQNEIENKSKLSKLLTDHISNSIVSNQKVIDTISEQIKATKIPYSSFEDEVKKSIDEYNKSVKLFADKGGKGFYDLAISMYPNHEMTHNDLISVIEELKENGVDIEILDNEPNEKYDEYRTRPFGGTYYSSLTVVLPSSHMDTLQEAINQKNSAIISTSFTEKSILCDFHAHFIMPYAYDEDREITLDSLKKRIAKERSKPERTDRIVQKAFTSLGFFRSELSYSGFKSENWDHLNDAMLLAFENLDLYQNTNDHINGLMPGPFGYTDEHSKLLGYEKPTRVNIVDDLKLREIKDRSVSLQP
ncbi:hypothetical protein JL827_25455 [Vibrio parahaemolyticus]|nr:hypothetical protein [Vibrio parahaemolyticus]